MTAVDMVQVRESEENLRGMYRKLQHMNERLSKISHDICRMSALEEFGAELDKISDAVFLEERGADALAEGLQQIMQLYDMTEDRIICWGEECYTAETDTLFYDWEIPSWIYGLLGEE